MKDINFFGRKIRIDYPRSSVEMTYHHSGVSVEWADDEGCSDWAKSLVVRTDDNFFVVNFRKEKYNVTQYIDTQKMEVEAVFSVDGRSVDLIKGKMCFID